SAGTPPPILPRKGGGARLELLAQSLPSQRSTLPLTGRDGEGWSHTLHPLLSARSDLRKKLIPAPSASPILPVTTPRIRTQALRTVGRDRFGSVGGRSSGGRNVPGAGPR